MGDEDDVLSDVLGNIKSFVNNTLSLVAYRRGRIKSRDRLEYDSAILAYLRRFTYHIW